MFAMGEHRIICGDSTDARSLEILMSDDEARLILTDEPYNVPVADMDRIAAGGAPCPYSKRRIARESLEIFASPLYRRGHDHDSSALVSLLSFRVRSRLPGT
jgi:hypothetical protein